MSKEVRFIAYRQEKYMAEVKEMKEFFSLQEAVEFFGMSHVNVVSRAVSHTGVIKGEQPHRWMIFNADEPIVNVESDLGEEVARDFMSK